MEFVRFIFSSPWIWLGFTVLICCVLKYAVDMINAIRAKRKVHTYKTKDGWQVLVTNASRDDVEAALVRQELREHLDEQMRKRRRTKMIKNFEPQPYDGLNSLPSYVSNISSFTLTGEVPGGYEITLAKLTVGESVSAGNPLSHALFESFDDHGRRMKTIRTRVSGFDREFVAVKSAMTACGFAFHPALPSVCETILYALGEFFQAQNPEIASVAVVSQSCH